MMLDPASIRGPAGGRPSRGRRTVRLQTLMIVIAGLSAWLASWRASPVGAIVFIVLAVMAWPTLALHRYFLSGIERETLERPGPIVRVLAFAVAAIVVAPFAFFTILLIFFIIIFLYDGNV